MQRKLHVMLSLLLILVLGGALPLAPYLLGEQASAHASSATAHSHPADQAPAIPEHVHCLKCVLVIFSLPVPTTVVIAELVSATPLVHNSQNPYQQLLLNPNVGARAPPLPSP